MNVLKLKTCKHVFKKGNKTNTKCDRKPKEGEMYCSKHIKSKNEDESLFEKDVLVIEDEHDETNWEEEEDLQDYDDDEEEI
jgi:hypothetical protein